MARAIFVGSVEAQVTGGNPVAHQRNASRYNCGSVSITTGSPAHLAFELLVVHGWTHPWSLLTGYTPNHMLQQPGQGLRRRI